MPQKKLASIQQPIQLQLPFVASFMAVVMEFLASLSRHVLRVMAQNSSCIKAQSSKSQEADTRFPLFIASVR